jgi:uncharacterized lipoprotein YajG
VLSSISAKIAQLLLKETQMHKFLIALVAITLLTACGKRPNMLQTPETGRPVSPIITRP